MSLEHPSKIELEFHTIELCYSPFIVSLKLYESLKSLNVFQFYVGILKSLIIQKFVIIIHIYVVVSWSIDDIPSLFVCTFIFDVIFIWYCFFTTFIYRFIVHFFSVLLTFCNCVRVFYNIMFFSILYAQTYDNMCLFSTPLPLTKK